MKTLSNRLKKLVDETVTLLGRVIREEMGPEGFRVVESTRSAMASLREADFARKEKVLKASFRRLEALSPQERLDCARAFTLMLELMNACENAYRNFSIRQKPLPEEEGKPDTVIYVLTAHPTEARAPENIQIFHEIQTCLTARLLEEYGAMSEEIEANLFHLLHLAWRCPVVRARRPKVQDEAEHIFSTLLREETLRPVLGGNGRQAPFYVRSWVGGDKDGHPGVNARTFRESLQTSRSLLVRFAQARVQRALEAGDRGHFRQEIARVGSALQKSLRGLQKIRAGDGSRVKELRRITRKFALAYERELGAVHPGLRELERSLRIFPGFVVPLEFRESSDMLEGKKSVTIFRMLTSLSEVARGGDPLWYVRGMIVSMARDFKDIERAGALVRRALKGPRIPVIPLFERAEDLARAPEVVAEMIANPAMKKARPRFWGGYLEVMVGYSDSSKESGVLPSRLQIAEIMHELDRFCRSRGVTPIFFQGSGGSVDRGGGSVPEQTAWWPAGALRNYKVTVQGEMVERSFASAEITRRQLDRINRAAGDWQKRLHSRYRPNGDVRDFADRVAKSYRGKVGSADFLAVIEAATPYPFLDRLRIGSRPAKRKNLASVSDLRAIPWVLCWTQTRVLFPTWWGVGSAWAEASPAEKKALRAAAGSDPVFRVFVRALTYTMAKAELAVWALYLERSGLDPAHKAAVISDFREEAEKVHVFLRALGRTTTQDESRAWLFESIYLRTPMIHPLNLLQLLALEKDDGDLLRLTVTGIANGMVATG